MKLIFCISCVLFIVSDRSVEQIPDTHTICLVSEEQRGLFCIGVAEKSFCFVNHSSACFLLDNLLSLLRL